VNEEDKKLQKQLVDEMMKVSKTNPDVMIYMQALMENYEKLEKKLDQSKNNWEELKVYMKQNEGLYILNALNKMEELEENN
jgi:hypothetical protein